MLRDQSPSNNQGASIEVCFKAFTNSTVETFKSTLRNASSEGRVNLTLYNIYVVQTHEEAEQLPRKRKKLSSHRLETWQVIAIVAFVILLVMAIIIYRLHVSKIVFNLVMPSRLLDTYLVHAHTFLFRAAYWFRVTWSRVDLGYRNAPPWRPGKNTVRV